MPNEEPVAAVYLSPLRALRHEHPVESPPPARPRVTSLPGPQAVVQPAPRPPVVPVVLASSGTPPLGASVLPPNLARHTSVGDYLRGHRPASAPSFPLAFPMPNPPQQELVAIVALQSRLGAAEARIRDLEAQVAKLTVRNNWYARTLRLLGDARLDAMQQLQRIAQGWLDRAAAIEAAGEDAAGDMESAAVDAEGE